MIKQLNEKCKQFEYIYKYILNSDKNRISFCSVSEEECKMIRTTCLGKIAICFGRYRCLKNGLKKIIYYKDYKKINK